MTGKSNGHADALFSRNIISHMTSKFVAGEGRSSVEDQDIYTVCVCMCCNLCMTFAHYVVAEVDHIGW